VNETELLFTDILNCNRLSLYLNKDIFLDRAKSSLVSGVLKRRMQGEPLQYILGKTEFMGLEFKVTADVFIPRPETEILVEKVLEMVTSHKSQVTSLKIMDIGTGSGNIAISLAKFLTEAKIYATDISKSALEIARANAQLNKVENSIRFFQGDLLMTYDLQLMTYDLIVSNPPYIPTAEIEALQPEVKHEPHMALDGGKDGLDFYRRIINKAPRYLRKDGFLIMEMGFNQKDAIKNIFQKSGYFEIIELIKDYNNMDRVIIAKKREREWIN
jgi:release factor glutamine methyltransferase